MKSALIWVGAVFSLLLTAFTAHAARVEVFPGAGTPLQDAISSAAAGDELFVHSGTYAESIVIDRPLRLRGANDGQVIIDAGCATDTAVDIAADDVRLDGHTGGTSAANFSFRGGASRTIRIEGRSGVQLKKMFIDGCVTGTALEISDSSKIKVKLVHPQNALIGILVRASTYVTLTKLGVDARQTVLRLEDIAPGAPIAGAKVAVRDSLFSFTTAAITPPARGVHFVAADGVQLKGTSIYCNTGTCIDIDANSDNNRILRNDLNFGVFWVDGGSGNEFLNNSCFDTFAQPCP